MQPCMPGCARRKPDALHACSRGSDAGCTCTVGRCAAQCDVQRHEMSTMFVLPAPSCSPLHSSTAFVVHPVLATLLQLPCAWHTHRQVKVVVAAAAPWLQPRLPSELDEVVAGAGVGHTHGDDLLLVPALGVEHVLRLERVSCKQVREVQRRWGQPSQQDWCAREVGWRAAPCGWCGLLQVCTQHYKPGVSHTHKYRRIITDHGAGV